MAIPIIMKKSARIHLRIHATFINVLIISRKSTAGPIYW